MNKAALVLGVVAVLGASFFAGQKSFGAVEYTHTEVALAVESCGEGFFVGQCATCDTCADDEWNAGGCSYFKNTLCTLCTDIKHCAHEFVRCETRSDQICTQCDAGFWGESCEKCTVCSDTPGMYETEACRQDADAVCAACTVCGDNEYTSAVCTANTNTECAECGTCPIGEWLRTKCQTQGEMKLSDLDSVYTLGEDLVCSACNDCDSSHPSFAGTPMYTTGVCKTGFNGNTECKTCSAGQEGEYISQMCQSGSADTLGSDYVYQSCTERREDEWTVFPCSPLHISDAVYQQCSQCKPGEYKAADCTETSDTLCPACPNAADKLFEGDPNFKSGLQYCEKDDNGAVKVRCGPPPEQSSKCGEWEPNKPNCRHGHSGGNCKWTSFCQDDFSGDSCCYHRHPRSCGSITARERVGKRAGYTGQTTADFVDFCRLLCDEFPDCMAFEVIDGGDEADPSGEDQLNGDSVCYFKAAYTQDPMHNFYGTDPSKDCYSNTCRQNSYNLVGSRFAKTINYKVDGDASGNAKTVGKDAGRR